MEKQEKSKERACITVFSIILASIALVISIVALSLSLPRCSVQGVGFDYLGLLVGILSLLVVVLTGLNVYTLIDFREHNSTLKKHEEDIDWLRKNKQNIKHALDLSKIEVKKGNNEF